jgi:phospholipase/carboxylesterase
MTKRISRRRFCVSAAAVGTAAFTGCRLGTTAAVIAPGDGRITARPGVAPTTAMAAGVHDLAVFGYDRSCWLTVPTGYEPSRAWPLALFFRGAITPARNYMDNFQPIADDLGLLILAPEATYRTWDLILGGFGPDVDFINLALQTTFRTVHVDANRIGTSGFSDGASYSLSLGLTNGDFFSRIAAYSPGFMSVAAERGTPSFFITHGNMDQVLPVEASRYIVEQLRSASYEVDFREFDGPHAVSLSLARASYEWMISAQAAPRRG